MLEDFVTTREAADRLGKSPERVLQFIRDGRLRAERKGRAYLISTAELDRFVAVPLKRTGRPRKSL